MRLNSYAGRWVMLVPGHSVGAMSRKQALDLFDEIAGL
jgi:hypothetical protein